MSDLRSEKAMKSAKRWFSRLWFTDQRCGIRRSLPGLVAHFRKDGELREHPVRDISERGIYVITDQRWYPATMLLMSLQSTAGAGKEPTAAITVKSKVVRAGPDGVGFSFVLPRDERRRPPNGETVLREADLKTVRGFLEQLRSAQGGALVEYILILPLVFLLIVNAVNYGGFFYAFIAVANAARAGADYAILGGPSVGGLQSASGSSVTSLITADVASLPNQTSLSVNICQNNNGTTTVLAGTCTSLASDPEPANYVLTSVDVTYTYIPFIPLFSFPALGISATIPPTTIHRRAVMRSFQ